MKKTVKITALLLAVCLLAPLALAACGDSRPVVMEYKNVRLTEDVYRYWLACYRAQFAYMETDENRARLGELAVANIQRSLVCVGLYDGYGLQLSTSTRDVINAAMDRLVENAGGKEALNEALSVWGMDYNGLKTVVTYEQKASALRQYLFGTYGAYEITEEQKEEFYQDTYARVKMIYIPYVDFVLDDDGNRIYDPKTGTYRYTAKTGTALEKQQARAAAVRAALATVTTEEAFEALIKTYNEDESNESYPNGYYFSKNEDYSTYIEEVPAAALAMEVGRTREVESDYGVHFLLRLENDEGAYENEANSDFFANFETYVADYAFAYMITSELPKITVYTEVKNGIRYEDVEPNFDIYWG